MVVFSSKEVGTFSFGANPNTLDSFQWVGPTATLKKKQHKSGDKMFPRIYRIKTILQEAQREEIAQDGCTGMCYIVSILQKWV